MPAPYDPEQAARQRAEQAAETVKSAGRARSAMTSPQKTSGGGGFKMNAPGSGSDKAADPPGKYDGGLSGGVIHTADQEQNIRSKAASGGVITNDDIDSGPHSYLGHFAGDSVLAKGHNVGKKPAGKTPLVRTVATRGFRKLPGSAVPQIGHAKYGHADTGLPLPRHEREAQAKMKAGMTRAMKRSPIMQHDPIPLGKSDGAPRAVSDVKLSLRHEQDALTRDLSHAKDHMESAAKHRKHIAERKKQLGKRR